jgi:uncharacterized protein (TIGR03067 family)
MTTSLLLSALLLGAPGSKAPPKQPVDLAGEWVRESLTYDGEPRPVKGASLTYKFDPDGRWLIRWPGEEWRRHSTYTLDRTADPVGIDFDFDPDRPDGQKMKGIVKFEWDSLTICLSNAEPSVRPTAFEAKRGSATLLHVFKRVKPKD